MPRSQTGSLGVLAIRDFRILFLGTLAAFTAFFTSTVIQGVVAFELTGSNAAVGTAVFGQGLGMVLCGPLGGAYADRLPKRRVIAVGQLIAATSFGTLGVLYAAERIALWHLVTSSFVFGCAFGFLGPARQALVVDLVPAARIGNAMALSNVANTMSRVTGPVVAGVLLDWKAAGPAAAYAVMSLLYALSSLSLLLLPKSEGPPARGRRSTSSTTCSTGSAMPGTRRACGCSSLFFVSVMLIGFPHVTLIPGLLENQLGRPSQDVTRYRPGRRRRGARDERHGRALRGLAPRGPDLRRHGDRLRSRPRSASRSSRPSKRGLAAMVFLGAASGGFHALNGAVVARETEPVYMGRVMSLTFLAFAAFSLSALAARSARRRVRRAPGPARHGAAVIGVAIFMNLQLARTPSGRGVA
jgi:hypothetical protein